MAQVNCVPSQTQNKVNVSAAKIKYMLKKGICIGTVQYVTC